MSGHPLLDFTLTLYETRSGLQPKTTRPERVFTIYYLLLHAPSPTVATDPRAQKLNPVAHPGLFRLYNCMTSAAIVAATGNFFSKRLHRIRIDHRSDFSLMQARPHISLPKLRRRNCQHAPSPVLLLVRASGTTTARTIS